VSARRSVTLAVVAEALSDMIDLADAWATCGPEGYTREEGQRRDKADRVLMRLYRRIEHERRVS
jgi:hypothetical protein